MARVPWLRRPRPGATTAPEPGPEPEPGHDHRTAADPARPAVAGYDGPLDRLLVAAATGAHPSAQAEFEQALLTATVLVAGWESPDGAFAPVRVHGPDGEVVPLFSSAARVQESWPTLAQGLDEDASNGTERLRVREARGRDVLAGVLGSGRPAVLNPYSSYGKVLLMAETSRLLAGGARPSGDGPVTVDGPARLEVGEPARVPEGLTPLLREHVAALAATGTVEAARLAWVRYPDGLSGYLLEVVTALPRERVLADLDRVVPLLGGLTLDVLVAAPGGREVAAHVPALFP